VQDDLDTSAAATPTWKSPVKSDRLRLVLLSFLMLFVELFLIRWMGAQLVYLSYFSNFVLLGSFLGIGMGFLRGQAKVDLFKWAPLGLFALVGFLSLSPVEINRDSSQLIFFGADPTGLPIWVSLPVVFLAVAGVMMTIGQGVAKTFTRFEPLDAYRLDIIGSIAGIIAFSALAFLRAPPLAWGFVIAVLFVALLEPAFDIRQLLLLTGTLILLAIASFAPNVSWSPYYKVTAFVPADKPSAIAINVNGIPHQVAEPIADRLHEFSLYSQPYAAGKPPPKNVLIIGAGSGNDVAAALAAGAQHVDAVEIDPRIQEIGAQRHPDHPYSDPRVTVHIDDGRAFLERTDTKYDLIILALPDSLTLVSGQSSLRLESYLFTREALESFKAHLQPDGTFTMYNLYRELWLRDRYANSLQQVFGQTPCLNKLDAQGTVAALSVDTAGQLKCPEAVWKSETADVPAAATDDSPFPYLREPGIPSFYLLTIGLILVASLVLIRLSAGEGFRSMVPYMDLLSMGAAFLLLETKSVVQFALLFGTTWFVNALVFAGVLLSVYVAVEISRRFRVPNRTLLYGALLLSLAAAWLVPVDTLLPLAPPARFLAAAALAFAPIFFANMIFADRFRDVGSSTSAFGANLIGAMIGGLLEYSALITGYRNLLFVVAVLYGIAFFLGKATWMKKYEGTRAPA